ncbi:LacI family DNA-binding transcriptional regulator [Sinomonas sp. JGH33]|uniref:LacI family DNA-binding transcriptional regulator n=1 Tax=Sinomonas terricola TaxID=3110330 RepID=A0ABU5TAP7_9MICC|nr:LacI family DNA-binding transcriptional regulator [Sinomonas sp. JGH33]MEA5456767.1 LacI family DNA-binding transcriptional regulator [Sinomonas sp. JGH33]
MSVTLDDVAGRAGVSRALVSLALNGSTRVSERSREKILAAVAELGYRPNLNARRLASRRTGTIGVLLTDLHNPIFADVLDGLDEGLGPLRDQILLASGFNQPSRERTAIESFLALQADAIILLGCQLPVTEIEELANTIPTVVVGRKTRVADSLIIDDTMGVRLVMEHLTGLGHTRIAHVDGGRGARAVARRQAYTEFMKDLGLERNVEIYHGDYTEKGGEAGFDQMWAQSKPTAVFAANDLSAIGVLGRARNQRVEIPAELSVAGFDNTSLAQSSGISLTTVGRPGIDMGHAAAELLTERLEDRSKKASHVLMEPALFVRSTTAQASTASVQG